MNTTLAGLALLGGALLAAAGKQWVGAIFDLKTGRQKQEVYIPGASREELVKRLRGFAKTGMFDQNKETAAIFEGGYGDAPERLRFNPRTGKKYGKSGKQSRRRASRSRYKR